MNQNDNIVFYQASNGTYHTTSTQEQIFESTNIQLPLTSAAVSEATHQYQEVFNGNIIEAEPLQQINIINANELIQSNNIIHNVVATETQEKDNVMPFHRLIRISGINTKGKGFQLITDHLPDANIQQPKTVNTSYMKTLNMNGTITRTVLVPQNTFTTTTTQIGTSNESSILSGQYIVTHNDISAIKPKPSVIRDSSYLVQSSEGNGVPIQLMDTLQPNGKILVQRIRRKNVRLKNGTQIKNVRSGAVKTNGMCFKVPIGTVTPVPLGIKPMKKILVQPEGLDLIGVEQVQNGQLHVVTDSGKTVPVNIESQNNVLYDPTPQKTRIVFKIVQPEDFHLYSQADIEETKKVKRPTIKAKPSTVQEKTITLSKVVTRSGRQVRPPKHITTTYNGLDGEDLLDEELNEDLPSTSKSNGVNTTSIYGNGVLSTAIINGTDKETIVPAVMEDAANVIKVAEVKKPSTIDKTLLRRKRIQCITCKKVYSGLQCIGKHLFNFPEHATTDRLSAILDDYKAQRKARELKPKVVKPSTIVSEPKPPIVNGTNNVTYNASKKETVTSLSDDLECKEDRNIFVSLVGIVERTSEECKASVFVRQLSALILKLKRLMPCLLFEDKSSSSCMINESVGRMLEVAPGKYKLNMNAIKCLGEQGGNCPHIPPKPDPTPMNITPSWLTTNDQNKVEKMSNANNTLMNNNQDNTNGLNNWTSTITDNNQTQNETHKWPPIISDSPLGSNELSSWKSPAKNKKKVKTNNSNNNGVNKWPSIMNSNQNKDEVRNWAPITDNSCQNNIEMSKWKPIANGDTDNDSDINKWTPIPNTDCQDSNELSTWAATVNNSSESADEIHKWTNTASVNCEDKNDLQWTTSSKTSCQDEDVLCKWKSTVSNGCQEKDELSEWTSAISNACQSDKDELSKWKSTVNVSNGCQNKNEWPSTISNGCRDKEELCKWPTTISNGCTEKEDLNKWTSTISSSCQDKDDLNKWPSTATNGCEEKDELDKWNSTTNNGKRKWIPIGTRDPDESSNTNDENWLSTNSDLILDNATFPQTVDNIKRWDPLQKQSRLEDCTPRSPWQANIPELNKIDIPQEIIRPQDHISSSSQPVPSDDSLTFDCATKMVEDIHSNLVFDINKDISLDSDVELKKKTAEPENFDFNDSQFDMQIDSDKLNFRSAQYNEMKYGSDILPPFRKIEPSKNLQLPVDSLSDISSDADKLPLPSTDGILSELGSESLGLTISNEHIEPMDTVETRKDVTLNQSENAVHCDEQSLLNSSDLNLPISNASTMSRNESILSVSESSLDGARLNLSSSLNLLDSLGPDCLSFSDSDLRNTSQMSLDLQDLFPFHHA